MTSVQAKCRGRVERLDCDEEGWLHVQRRGGKAVSGDFARASPERTQTRFGSELIRQTLVARDAKALGLPGLLARNIVREDDPRVPMTSTEFLAEAWKVANDKARELGWIV
jgi:hypothetical protein